MPPIVLKIKGNESFLPFSNLDQEELSKTWRVCTKVKDSLENGSRLENLSWRLWFIQNVLVSNDISKSKSKFQKWSSKTTRKMENEQELTPTTPLKKKDTAFMSQVQHTESLLDYSLDEIKPVGTENFILNQFTSDQEGNQMIELKDIFPFSMQEDFFNAVSETNDASYYNNNTLSSNSTAWPLQNSSTIYQQPNYNISPSTSPYTNNNGYTMQQDFYSDPISGIHSLFADHMDLPAMNIPVDNAMMQQDNYVVDFNNAAYVAAAAAATAAALTTIPNATLHNKLLATLPRQTLVSAERLLSPANKKRPSLIAHKQQQQQRMTEALPPNKPLPESNKKQQQQHYFSTFQLDTGKNNISPSATKHTKQDYSSPSPTTTNDENSPQCSNCDATSTPLWRRSADDKILCNACGLYLKLHNAPRPKHLKPSNGKNKDGSRILEPESEEGLEENQTNLPQTVCTNCRTNKTPLWRRDNDGSPLCNACGLYLKLHNEKRPMSMKTDIIKKRQRTETLIASSNTDEPSKKPRYYDQQALEKGSALGYRNAASSLPGTGILMMTTDSPP